MEQLELLLVALTPSVGTLVAAVILAIKGCFEIKALRNELKDESTIKAIYADNKRLNAKYKETISELAQIRKDLEESNKINQELACAIKQQNREV